MASTPLRSLHRAPKGHNKLAQGNALVGSNNVCHCVQLNWTGVQFASTNLTRVTSVTFSQGGELIDFAGDNNRYPVVIANTISRPRCSITSGDAATLMGISPGTSGTLTATQNDALGVSGGAINWSMSNAVHQNTDDTGPWGQFATATATFRAYASDGATNPLSFTRS